MSPSLDQLIERVLHELSLSSAQGTSISELFQRIDNNATPEHVPLDGDSRNLLWAALIARDDITFPEGKSAGALKKLSLDDILGLGLGQRVLKLRMPAGPDNAPDSSIAVVIPTSSNVAATDGPPNKPTKQTNEPPKPKRRGRPPGKAKPKPDPYHRIETTTPDFRQNTPIAEPSSSENGQMLQSIPSVSGSRPGTPLESIIREDRLSPEHMTPVGPRSTPKRTRFTLGDMRRAKFTPYEKVQRDEDDAKIEAGLPGVYINPTVSQAQMPGQTTERKPKNRMFAVFKSDKLKIPQWLAARTGTWKELLAERTQGAPISIDHSAVGNIPQAHGSTPLRQIAPNRAAETLLRPNGGSALPVMNIAGPQHHNNVGSTVYDPNTVQNMTQLGTIGFQQAGNLVYHSFNQLSSPYPVVNSSVPHQYTYNSLYSPSPASTSQSGIPPVVTTTYKSPYQSPYQPTIPPSMPTTQPWAFLNSGISGAIPSNIQYPRVNGDSVKASTSTPTPFTTVEGKRKREVSEDSVYEPDKRLKNVPTEPNQPPSIIGSASAVVVAPTSTTPQNPLLEEILKQKEEEKAKEAEREREFQDKLSAAELLDVPEHLVRLTAEYQNTVGSLILSPDQTTLSFLSMDQPPPENVVWTLPISTMSNNPIVSMTGSKPMELRVKSRDDSNVETIHRFNIGQTERARKAADVMRAKLVLAKINIRGIAADSPYLPDDEADDAEIAELKPFLCEKCGKRFKNREGIVYHKNKSQTSCNPNFDPSTVRAPGSWLQAGRKKKVKIVEPTEEAKPQPEQGEEKKEGQDGQPESDNSDSVDSIIEWAEKASRQQRQTTSSRRRRGSSIQSDEEQPPAPIYFDEGGSDRVSGHSSDEGRSSDDDAYLPIEEKNYRHRKRAMQERWARSKAMGRNTLLGDEMLHSQSSLSASNTFRTALEQREKRAAMATHKQQCWDTAPSCLPNISTGAWDQKPERVRRTHRRPVRRYELPEPVTFMQSEDGAWSVRPFGHGVKPIYARPTRRADGNPYLPGYLKRIENGFRPVVMPTKNRLLFPAAPGKRLLADPTSYTPPPSIEELEVAGTRSRYQRGESQQSMSTENTDNLDDVRMSKATGKPVRSYRRGYESASKGARSRGSESKNQHNLDQIHVLNSLEPKKLEPAKGMLRNPGLDSLPLGFGLGFSRVTVPRISEALSIQDPERLREELPVIFSLSDILVDNINETQPRMLSDIDQVAMWEQGRGSEFLSSGTLKPDYRWINHTLDSLLETAELQHVEVSWDESRTFDMVTLPYAELGRVEDVAMFIIPPALEYKVPRSSLKPASRDARDLRELHKGWTTRRLTALSSDLVGLGESPEEIAKQLGTQIASPVSITRTRNGDANMSEADDARLMVGICVIRTLTGGLDQNIDWVLVSTLFDSFSMNFLTKRWTTLFQKKRVVVEKLMADFQESFLPAYQSGEIPPLCYDDLVAYDWNWLVQWTMSKVDISLDALSIELPDTRERLDKLYYVKEQALDNSRQENYFSLTYPVYKRLEVASSVANTIPAIKHTEVMCADDIEIDTLTLLKSWVRAASLTPDEVWDPQIMKTMFKSLSDPDLEDDKGNDPSVKKLVEQAAESLRNEKVLMRKNRTRVSPDRTYEPTDVFFGGLRKHVTVQQFVDAARFKDFLDQKFSRGVPCVRSDYLANEGMLMCVTHLQAHGRIRLKPVGMPMNKFGYGEGSYETRKIPKEKFHFDIDIYPTAKYIYDVDNEVLNHLKGVEPPRGGERGELPMWYGIGDRLIMSLWQRALVAFAGIISLRSGSNVEALVQTFKPTLEEWEIWRLLEWGTNHGLFERLHESISGWTTREWWWLIVGWCCAGPHD